MNYALTHCNLLDGNLNAANHMPIQKNRTILIHNERIKSIQPSDSKIPPNYKIINLNNKYILPGLINLHVHLAPSSKPKKKPTNYARLSSLIRRHPWILNLYAKLQENFARDQLLSGVTTIRTVGGLKDLDAKLRDRINRGELIGPRVLVSNTAISVPGGHFAGLLATESRTPKEAVRDVARIAGTNPDWIKLMITGGVLDAEKEGEPGVLRMSSEIVKAACDKAHQLGYRVAAHVESTEGVRVALQNGVDTIEHGAAPDKEILHLFKERNAAHICTLSPALPFEFSAKFKECYGEVGKKNGSIVLNGMIDCAKACLAENIPVGLGTDSGCPYVTQYDMWRELLYFVRYCHVTPDFAVYTATKRNAEILGISGETGTLESGKYADFIVVDDNPLGDLSALRRVRLVAVRGRYIKDPKIKKDRTVEKELDKFL